MTMLLRIAERVLNRPLLVHPDKVPLILGVLEGRIPIDGVSDLKTIAEGNIDAMPEAARAVMRGPSPGASRFVGDAMEQDPQTGKARPLPYRRTSDGVAVITITGSLVNRGAWLGSNSGETSYEGIKYQVGQAANDPRARSILLDIESPGGEAVGAFEAASAVREAAKAKQVVAVVNGMAASAAYALASGASKIITTPTGLAGSIGVVMMHVDYSAYLENKGVKPTLIFAGAHKVDGNPFEPLSNAVKEDLQAEVMQFYSLFVKTVAQGRKGLSAQQIRATEARTFVGKDAIDAGLADELGTFESALADLSRGVSRAKSMQPKGVKMDRNEGAPAAESAGISLADHNAAVAKAKADGIAEGIAAGKKTAHDRFAAILADDKIKGKETTALDLALKSPEMSAADVADFVAKLSIAQPAAKVPGIEERMRGQGADLAMGGPMTPASHASSGWDDAIAKVNASFGIKH